MTEDTLRKHYADLQSRGEKDITYNIETGIFISHNGKHTTNYWYVNDKNELICFDCKSSYLPRY